MLGQAWGLAVLVGENRVVDRPANPNCRIIPGNAQLVGRIVVVRALIFEVGKVAGDTDAVCESGRHIDLAKVICRKRDTYPFQISG